MDIEDFKNRKWELFGAPCTPLVTDMFAVAPARYFVKTFGLSCEVLCLFKGNYVEWLYDNAQIVAFSGKILPSLLGGPWEQYERCRQTAKKYADLHEELMERDLSILTDAELDILSRKYIMAFMKQFAVNNLIEPISFYFQTRFRSMLLAEGVRDADIDVLMNAYGRSKYPNYVKLCLAEYQQAKNDEEINAVLKKYAYLSNDYLGPKVLTRAYVEELRKQKIHEPDPHLHIELSSNAKKLLEVFRFIATLQDVRKAESLMMVSGTHLLAAEHAKRIHMPIDVLLYALWDEILDRDINEERLRGRMEQSAFFYGQERTEIFEGEESRILSALVRQSIYGNPEKMSAIKGICASPGKASGVAVIAMQPNDFHRVQKGNVLFTMMTRPEFLPVMQLAAAFVTDEGGITSHAAIVAREMKKPCIIATKVGTKVIKDGMLVEVDADKGIVKILET